jgi:hypothetical protein
MYLRHLTDDHYHLQMKEATEVGLMGLMQHYKSMVPEDLQDGREEWPADLKLQWQQHVLHWIYARALEACGLDPAAAAQDTSLG